jgi:hypothetical protein
MSDVIHTSKAWRYGTDCALPTMMGALLSDKQLHQHGPTPQRDR